MATNTTNLKLVKPSTSDAVDITVINSNMDKIDAIVDGKDLGEFTTLDELNTKLNTELASMPAFTWRPIRVRAMESIGGIFVTSYRYHGVLYKNSGTTIYTYSHVMLYSNASNDVITGQYSTSSSGGTWAYDKLAKRSDVNTMLSSVIGNLQVYTKTIPANGGTATIRVSSTMPCLVFTSLSSNTACFSGHYASITPSAAVFRQLYTPGSSIDLSAASGGGLVITNNHTAGISLIVIRLMGNPDEVTITTASA